MHFSTVRFGLLPLALVILLCEEAVTVAGVTFARESDGGTTSATQPPEALLRPLGQAAVSGGDAPILRSPVTEPEIIKTPPKVPPGFIDAREMTVRRSGAPAAVPFSY